MRGDESLMSNNQGISNLPYLLTRAEASLFLGIDEKSFDKYVRSHNQLKRYMIGRHERYTIESLKSFIDNNAV